MTEQQKDDSYSIEIPKQDSRHFIVNFPGYIRNEDKALATFGGIDGVSRQRQNHPKYLQLSLRPADPYAHPITSNEYRPRKAIILKITCRRQSHPSSHPSVDHYNGVTVECIATTNCSYCFTTPSDMQYVGRDRRSIDDQWSSQTEREEFSPDGLPPHPLLCAPSTFLVESSIDYSYKQYKATDHSIETLGRKPKPPRSAAMIDFFAKSVPQPYQQHDSVSSSPGALIIDRFLSEASRAHLARLDILLRKRPVFVEHALTAAMAGLLLERGEFSSHQLTPAHGFPSTKAHMELLTKICYRFKNGPWRGAWIRKGYDPRNIPESKQYQVVEYSLPTDWYAPKTTNDPGGRTSSMSNHANHSMHLNVSAAAAAATTGAHTKSIGSGTLAELYTSLCAFKCIPPTTTTILQLCDLEDPEIQSLIRNEATPVAPTAPADISRRMLTPTTSTTDTCVATAALTDAVLATPAAPAPCATDGSGWFSQSMWERIKARVSERFNAVLREHHPGGPSAGQDQGPKTIIMDQHGSDGARPMVIDSGMHVDADGNALETGMDKDIMAYEQEHLHGPLRIDDVLSPELMDKIKYAFRFGVSAHQSSMSGTAPMAASAAAAAAATGMESKAPLPSVESVIAATEAVVTQGIAATTQPLIDGVPSTGDGKGNSTRAEGVIAGSSSPLSHHHHHQEEEEEEEEEEGSEEVEDDDYDDEDDDEEDDIDDDDD